MTREAPEPYAIYRLMEELEEIMGHHDSMLKALRAACIKVKRGSGSTDLVERRIQRARSIRGKMLLNLKAMERLAEHLDNELALEVSAMMIYIEMSATKDEKRYLTIAKKILGERGLQIDIEQDLGELEEIAEFARKISEKLAGKSL